MKDIIEPVDTEDGLFHDGDPSTGAEGTTVYAGIMNAIQGGLISTQSEIKTILTSAGINPDSNAVDQLLNALKKLFASADEELIKNALQKSKNLSDVEDKARALKALNGVAKTQKVNDHALEGDVNVTAQDIFDGQAVYLGESADLNSYTTPGLYYQPANTGATAGKNYPEPNAGSLVIYKHAGITQVYRICNTSRSYVRTMYAGVWSAWVMQYDKDNKPTPKEIGALPIGGGTLTGPLLANGQITTAAGLNIYAGANIIAGNGAVYEGSTRVYSPNNPQPIDTSWVAGSQWVMENFLTNAVLGAEGFFDQQGGATTWTFKAPAGCMLTGMIARYTGSNSAHNIGGLYYKPILVARNNTWVQIGG